MSIECSNIAGGGRLEHHPEITTHHFYNARPLDDVLVQPLDVEEGTKSRNACMLGCPPKSQL